MKNRTIQNRSTRALFFLLLCATAAIAINSGALARGPEKAASKAPEVNGIFEGITFRDGQYYLTGLACQVGVREPLQIQVFADASAYSNPPGKFVISGVADQPTPSNLHEQYKLPADQKSNFKIPLDAKVLAEFGGHPFFVHGIRKIQGVKNAALEHSGEFLCPCPLLKGQLDRSNEHPHIFVTEKELKQFAERANRPDTLTQAEFEKLAKFVGETLSADRQWNVAYSGTDIFIYLHTFSFLEEGGYVGETRSEAEVNAALKLPPSAKPPRGAGLIASRLALYGALLKNGATPPPHSAAADDAIGLCKKILLTWARKGFRDANGEILQSPQQFSEGGKFDAKASADVGLQVSRGAIYSVHAQDLLEGLGALSADEIKDLNHFHTRLADLVRLGLNGKSFGTVNGLECGCFDNHHANDLAFMLAEARLENNEDKFWAVLYGGNHSYLVNVPWNLLFNKNIYGLRDKPRKCYENKGNFFQNDRVELGEIDDRFRGLPYQSIGYPMFSYQRLLDAAQIIRNAGLDPFGYRGVLQQSLEAVGNYYSCFLANAGFEKTITSTNCTGCANWEQYNGKSATGAGQMVRAVYWYPQSATLQKIDADSKAWMLRKGSTNNVDAISFGRWHD